MLNRSVLTASPVVASPEPDAISPLMLGKSKEVDDFSLDQVSSGNRLSMPSRPISARRPRAFSSSSPRISPALLHHIRHGSRHEDDSTAATAADVERHHLSSTLDQVVKWLHTQKKKRHGHRRRSTKPDSTAKTNFYDGAGEGVRKGDESDESDSSLALGKLEEILRKANIVTRTRGNSTTNAAQVGRPHRMSSSVRLRAQSIAGGGSSDTEYVEGDAIVPDCEAMLDNSKTLAYGSVGAASSSRLSLGLEDSSSKANDAWSTFKFEIVRLTHTLRIKGWRNVPMERSSEIEVERLCGALTNAVYVVTPPRAQNLASRETSLSNAPGSPSMTRPKKRTPKYVFFY